MDLLDDWRLHLRASNKAPRTITAYLEAGTKLAAWIGDVCPDEITHRDVQRYLVCLAETPHQRTGGRVTDSYVAGHYRRLQQFFRWLEEESEIQRSPFARLKPPSVPVKPVPLLDDSQVRRLLTTPGKRDQAVLRVLLDTGVRVSELVSMQCANPGLVHGKGRKLRTVYWTDPTELAVRRYLRTRSDSDPRLWVGRAGPLTASGVRQIIEKLGEQAGIPGLHPHMFRHLFAHNFLDAGGNEGDLMRLCGWSSREMVLRYASSGADKRAHDAYRRLNVTAKY